MSKELTDIETLVDIEILYAESRFFLAKSLVLLALTGGNNGLITLVEGLLKLSEEPSMQVHKVLDFKGRLRNLLAELEMNPDINRKMIETFRDP